MIDWIAPTVVLLAGLFLVCLGVLSLTMPAIASRFLRGFASSAGLHYVELGSRFAVGGAFLLQAPAMRFPLAFTVAGWVLVLSTAGLMLVPWRWHRRFAQQAVPRALHFLPIMGVASLALGGFVLFSLSGSSA